MASPPRKAPSDQLPRQRAAAVRDLRGGVRLLFDGLRGGIDRLERAHQRLAEVDPPVRHVGRPASGVGGLVWRGVRGGTDLLGGGLDLALASLQAALVQPHRDRAPVAEAPEREALVVALNAVAGDHLHRTDNPLAIPTHLRVREGPARPRVLVLVHDLGMGPLQWRSAGHDHGEALAQALDATPVVAGYNSGRHVAATGPELSAQLEELLARWRVPVQQVDLLGHGMGGLVLRSALHHAERAGLAWLADVRHVVFLGTPHHGALHSASRRLGWRALAPQPLAAGLSRLAGRRSDGIADVLEGRVGERARADAAGAEPAVLLPAGLRAHAIAGAVGDGTGDGLVAVSSALGRHPVASRDLGLAPEHCWTVRDVDHLGLLGSEAVFQKTRQWLAG